MKHPAYHLRTNKAVDRLSLMTQIRSIMRDETRSVFYSLSGPFLEDMKLAHSVFPAMKLVSIESNEQTHLRQKFHAFSSRLKLENRTLDDYLTHDYQPGAQDFFWLDFTDLTTNSLHAFRKVLVSAPHLSLIRLTVRAEPDRTLSAAQEFLTEEQKEEIRRRIDEKFLDNFGAVLSNSAPKTPLGTRAEFARVCQMMIRRIASEALDNGGDRDFAHLQSTRYDDGVQMLSVTGVVALRGEIEKVKRELKEKRMKLQTGEWDAPVEIEVPHLSMLERHLLDRTLPKSDRETVGLALLRKLKYQIDNGERRTAEALRQYARHYRDYPSFVKINM